MKGINGKPYIDCSPYLDVNSLNLMNLEICSGIALSSPKAGVYGPNIKDSQKYGNLLMLKSKIKGQPHELNYKWHMMTHDQQNIFAKLFLKLYNPSSVVYLREPKQGIDGIHAYMNKADKAFFDWTPNIIHFPTLRKWLDSLIGPVFESYGRILFFIHEHDCKLLIHRDGVAYAPHKNEFLWINPKASKKNFFIWDEDADVKHYVNTTAAFFNDLDMHGGDPSEYASWSLRIDGKFTDSFKQKLGIDHIEKY